MTNSDTRPDEPLSKGHTVDDDRSLARFFFEQGYFSCWAEAMAIDDKPPFEITEPLLDKAWDITAIARDDYAEFDSRLALADAAPDLLAVLERVWDAYGFDPSIDSSIWQDVRAAISRARGES